MYKCGKCGQTVKELPKGMVRCPACAYRILYKIRPPVTKKAKAE